MTKYEEKEMTYKQICQEYGLEKKRGKAQQLQFQQLEKQGILIDKIPNVNKYLVRKLTTAEQKKLLSNPKKHISYKKELEPMVVDALSRNDMHLIASNLELQYAFGLINTNFIDITKCTDLAKSLAESIGTELSNLKSFKREVYELNKDTIDSILKGLDNKQIIVCRKVMVAKNQNNEVIILPTEIEAEIIARQNELAKEYNNTIYYKITREPIRQKINDIICKEFNIKSKYYAYDIYLKSESLKSYLAEFPEYKSKANLLTQIKVENSTRGDLKFIVPNDKLNMINSIITIDDKEKTSKIF